MDSKVCRCFTIAIYCLGVCLAEGFCVLIPTLQFTARKFRTCERFQRPSDSSASIRIYVFAGAELQCHKLFICSYYIMGICRLLSPVLFSCLCANTSLILWKEVILYFSWRLLQEHPPHKSLKENGISRAKTDGCKMHVTVMFIWRVKKALGYLELLGFILVNLACCVQFSWQRSLGCVARAAVGFQKDFISLLIVAKNHLFSS